ncbi:MAG: T9SS type A sorting domain-containing protein, partial [Candidatus Eisenbacteria bacterium]|nr:T9SS type A sorting domain-containing protein [Candidatus Eisenbacteria bacterium]
MFQPSIRGMLALVLVTSLFSIAAHAENESLERAHRKSLQSQVDPTQTFVIPDVPPADAVPEMPDNPEARFLFEIGRLVDPATGVIPPDIAELERKHEANMPKRNGSVFEALLQDLGVSSGHVSGWAKRGPINVGGRTRALAIDVSDPSYQTLLAGGVSGGMWRSTDQGATWIETTGTNQHQSVSCIAQDTRSGQENTWYHGTGELRGSSAGLPASPYSGDGVYKSTDGGQSWAVLVATCDDATPAIASDFAYVHQVAIDPTNLAQAEVYAATRNAIYRSVDGGASWTAVIDDPLNQSSYTDVAVGSNGRVFASLSSNSGTEWGVYTSSDGVTWSNITPPTMISAGRIALEVAPSNPDVLYALVSDYNTNGVQGFFHYNHGTGTWDDRSSNIDSLENVFGNPAAFQSYSSYCQQLTVNPTNENTVYIGGVWMHRSTDGFATELNATLMGGWLYEPTGSDEHHADVHNLVFQPGSSTIAYSSSDGGVHKTTNAGANEVLWENRNNGYHTSQFYTCAIDEDTSNDYLLGGLQDNGTVWTNTQNFSTGWPEVYGGDGSFCAVANHSGINGDYYVSSQGGVTYRYTLSNTGSLLDWARVDPTGGGYYLFINPLTVDPNDDLTLYIASSSGVWRNTNPFLVPSFNSGTASENWDTLSNAAPGDYVSALTVSNSVNGILYYGTASGKLFRINNAATAPALTAAIDIWTGKGFPAGAYVSSIAIDPNDDQHVVVAFSNYYVDSLFETLDGGTSWQSIEGNLGGNGGPSVRAVRFLSYTPPGATGPLTLLFVGTTTGLYSSYFVNGSNTVWTQESSDLIGAAIVDAIATREVDKVVIAATHGKGMYQTTASAATVTSVPDERARAFRLGNAPNPFRSETTISFQLEQKDFVSLEVFNPSGQRVRTLERDHLNSGAHTYRWDGKNSRGVPAPAGIYFYRLRAGNEITTERM